MNMASKAVLVLLLVVCFAKLNWASPATLHVKWEANETSAGSTDDAATSSSNNAINDDDISRTNVVNEMKDNIKTFFSKIFGKRAIESSHVNINTSSSLNNTSSSDESSSGNIFDNEDDDNVEGFFGHLFGKRDLEFQTSDVFNKIYEEWLAENTTKRSGTERDSGDMPYGQLFHDIFEEVVKGNFVKRSVTVRDNGNMPYGELFRLLIEEARKHFKA